MRCFPPAFALRFFMRASAPDCELSAGDVLWDTSLAALLSATLLWATLELAESKRWRDWSRYGLLWGFTLMTNPSLGSLLPFLLGWAAYRAYRADQEEREIKFRPMKPALASAGIAILCCVPWTVRNYAVFHRFVPLRSNLPLELYIGNNENYAPHASWPPKILPRIPSDLGTCHAKPTDGAHAAGVL